MANQSAKSVIGTNSKIIKGYIIGFIIVSLMAYLTKIAVNYFGEVTPLLSKVEKPVVWNSVVFALLILRAYWVSKARYDHQTRKFLPGKELYKSVLIDIVLLSTIIQFIVFFTEKALYMYILIPVYMIYFIIKKICAFF